MDTCLELITDQVKLSEPGMDVVWILHHACSKSVGVTLKKGSWVSTNDVTSVVETIKLKKINLNCCVLLCIPFMR